MANGTFLLADIGGYTTFLTEVGLEHAKEITSHLLNGMVDVNPERWQVGNVVGDCLFLYNDSDDTPEEIFAQLRGLYENFCESITEIAAGSTCRCGACDRTNDLALKFVVHGGEFAVQDIAGRRELIGPDIIVAHRLLKNSVAVSEYVLLTEPLGEVAKASGLSAIAGSDQYDDVGTLDYVYVDLQPVREAYEKSREVYLNEETADVVISIEIAAPPDLVWELMHDRDKMIQATPTLLEFESISGGLDDVGSIHTCLHGGGMRVVHLRVGVDQAGRRITDRLWNVPFVHQMYQTCEVRPSGTGSRATLYYALRPGVPMDEGVTKADFVEVVRLQSQGDVEGMKTVCEAELQARQ